jgi:tRNA-specific 2-thiouridylase
MVRVVQGQIQSLLTDEPSSALATAKINSNSGKPTVAMLLSGGVDSSVALNLLHSQGYSVTAFYLKIWLEDELAHLGQCPWEDDYDMCIQVCNQAGVPLESISLQQEYKETVISYTVAAAQRGRTPNPDIMCNSRVKFGCFYDAIEGRGFDYVASGHYAQLIADDNGAKQLLRAPDAVKDQSYFLCALKQEQLQRVLFPIGHLEKHEVRQLAQDYDLPNKNRPDSQGLCFLGKVKFDEFLAAYLGESPGDIIDARTGGKIGRHNGVWYHTVGQRKGIGKVLDPKATAKGPW